MYRAYTVTILGGVDVRRTTVIGLAGSLVQLTFAAWLGGIASGVDAFPNPPEPVPRGLALGLLYTLPAVIGAVGALRRRRSMLAAAAVLSCAGSMLAFSGVTLVFLVPALVFATAAGVTSGVTPRARPSWRALVLLALSVAAVVVAVLRLGILVLPLLVLFVLALEVGRGLRADAAGPGSQVAGTLLAVRGGLPRHRRRMGLAVHDRDALLGGLPDAGRHRVPDRAGPRDGIDHPRTRRHRRRL